MRVLMLPHLTHLSPKDESGIKRVVEAYFRHLPKFGIELVDPKAGSYDLRAVHAGMTGAECEVSHVHGLYWSGDYNAPYWEYDVNARIVDAVRSAKEITVPSEWVAETFKRDMRVSPHVIPHGIDWEEWQHDHESQGYVLWNKNRSGLDVVSIDGVRRLAERSPQAKFLTTVKMDNQPGNVRDLGGVVPHARMKEIMRAAEVYLSTTKETFGIGVLEAMASGVPVLGFDYGGNSILVEHGISGYLARPGDYDDLARGLEYCLKHRKVLGANGRELARNWTWEAACSMVAEVYEEALKEEPPTVSVIIPCYNYGTEDKLGRAIRSVQEQTYSIDKIVIVDDGSPDGGATEDLVKKYGNTDNRIIYKRIQNSGVAVARNTGIGCVDSRFVCCLDADDTIGPDFIRVCIEELEKDRSLGIAYTGIHYKKPDGVEGISFWPSKFDYDQQLQKRNQVPTACVFRRKMWERLGGYRSRYAVGGAGSEDAELWLRAGAYGFNAKMVDYDEMDGLLRNYRSWAGGYKRKPTEAEFLSWVRQNRPEFLNHLFRYSLGSGRVSGNPEYREVDWTSYHPWTKDGLHPFASVATPKRKSHPVRQYDQPVISVVIPVGPGHEKNLEGALDSLEAQTFRKWEAVVVWDGIEAREIGKDRFEIQNETVGRMMAAYPYVRWLTINNSPRGAGAARNFGASHARAPFLFFLDADDLLRPEALQKHLDAWDNTHAIAYSDYTGTGIVENVSDLHPALQERILHRDERTKETVTLHYAKDYDCEKAQRQPEKEGGDIFYYWCNVSILVPKAWHDEIGGFDESMPSWEDIDYHFRMARAGKCYTRVPEPLLVYRFYSGGRRNIGLQNHPTLLKYLQDKRKEADIMACGSCGGNKRGGGGGRTSTATAASQMMADYKARSGRESNRIGSRASVPAGFVNLQDDKMIECTYMSGNRGMHQVTGATTKVNYGYRAGGGQERFLVHEDDIKAQPHLFVPVQMKAEVVDIPVEKREPLPPPNLIVKNGEILEDLKEVMAEEVPVKKVPAKEVPVVDDGYVEEEPTLDLQSIAGVTPGIAEQLTALGIGKLEDILALGKEGLEGLNGVGPSRAGKIVAAARRKLEREAVKVEEEAA